MSRQLTSAVNLRSSPEVLASNFKRTMQPREVFDVLGGSANCDSYTWQRVTTAKGERGWLITGFDVEAVIAPPPVVVPTLYKVGAHCMGYLSQTDIDAAIKLNASVYKSVDSDAIARIRAKLPDRTYIFRHYFEQNGQDIINAHGVDGALDLWFNALAPNLANFPWAFFEGFNETALSPEYLEFEGKRIIRLAQMGLKACIINCSVGAENADFWKRAAPLLKIAQQYGAIVGVHCYAQSVMWDGYAGGKWGADGLWNGKPLFPQVRDSSGYEALRIRKDVEDIKALGFNLRLVGTEGGLDDLASEKEPAQGGNGIYYPFHTKTRGWKTCIDTGVWQKLGYLNGITGEQFYKKQLDWLSWAIADVPEIIGITIFNHGKTKDWDKFDTVGVY